MAGRIQEIGVVSATTTPFWTVTHVAAIVELAARSELRLHSGDRDPQRVVIMAASTSESTPIRGHHTDLNLMGVGVHSVHHPSGEYAGSPASNRRGRAPVASRGAISISSMRNAADSDFDDLVTMGFVQVVRTAAAVQG